MCAERAGRFMVMRYWLASVIAAALTASPLPLNQASHTSCRNPVAGCMTAYPVRAKRRTLIRACAERAWAHRGGIPKVFAAATVGFAYTGRADVAAAEPPPETTRLRPSNASTIGLARRTR